MTDDEYIHAWRQLAWEAQNDNQPGAAQAFLRCARDLETRHQPPATPGADSCQQEEPCH